MVRTRAAGVALVLLAARAASAQSGSTTQIWGNVTLDWHTSPRVTYSLDIEPKVMVAGPPGQPGWASIDLTPSAEFAMNNWLDAVGEGVLSRTDQTDHLRTTELAGRGGLRLHLFSRQEHLFFREHLPKRRLVIRDLVRWECRHLSYSDDTPTSSSWRFRNRIEFLYPLNRPNLGSDGAVHLLGDWEWYVQLKGDLSERFANKRRFRAGLGYRRNRTWQMEALYMRSASRNTIDQPFATSENIIDLRVKRVW